MKTTVRKLSLYRTIIQKYWIGQKLSKKARYKEAPPILLYNIDVKSKAENTKLLFFTITRTNADKIYETSIF